MFLQTYGAAIAIIVASVILGQAVCTASGIVERAWAAPMVGLALLIILEGAAIKLPGDAVAADIVGLVVLGVAIVYLVAYHRRTPELRRRLWRGAEGLAVALIALAAVSIPFLASGRVGLQGPAIDNDTSAHLLWAEALRNPHMAALWAIPGGYPLGPHSVVAALGSLFGAPLDAVFSGLLVSIAPLSALAARGVLRAEAPWRRIVVGVLCGLVYLVAAYYGEGAFKETIMAGLVLAYVVHLDQVRERFTSIASARQWLQLAPALIIVIGGVYTYSYVAVVWFGATLGLWALVEIAASPRRALRWVSRRNLTLALRPAVLVVVAGVILVLPIVGEILSFFNGLGAAPTSLPAPLGNLIGPLSPYEMFGVSTSPDFRFVRNTFHAGEVAAFATAVVVYGFLWSVWRRERRLVAASALAAIVIWWVSHRGQSPYVAAKAMVIASPLVTAVVLRALLTRTREHWRPRLVRLAVAIIFCGLAAYSAVNSLRDDTIQAPVPGHELESFHHIIGRSPVLFLGDDDFAGWLLRDAPVGTLTVGSSAGVTVNVRPQKPVPLEGKGIDFDSVAPADLDHFQYVVTTTSAYNSQAYPNFHLVASGRFYELWHRTGPTVPRQVVEPQGTPAGVLDCHSPIGRRLRTARGVASVMPAPPLTFPGSSLGAGKDMTVRLRLPAGRWSLSVQYESSFQVDFAAPGLRTTMPAYLGRLGPLFALGTVTGRGVGSPVVVTASARRPSLFTSRSDNLFTAIPLIAATRLPNTRRLVALKDACGRYVDWYRTS